MVLLPAFLCALSLILTMRVIVILALLAGPGVLHTHVAIGNLALVFHYAIDNVES
jgi:hypothetical protein